MKEIMEQYGDAILAILVMCAAWIVMQRVVLPIIVSWTNYFFTILF